MSNYPIIFNVIPNYFHKWHGSDFTLLLLENKVTFSGDCYKINLSHLVTLNLVTIFPV